ncbi:non-hydrolyzing UDP-N-acetylglucosamine 2-epimerase [Helicobacter sp. MIT 14-3879]|uniref:non-hydrolyzing UDP-N-acetylglucosamine 2-epimerase n=1 Tax=Helicobacter sp. MIT 14-3879 TaxID=2040649 RepID=UPI000E1F29C8|nr:UDP-N-acetylglucosamine 2-epimerase (non-hydrolyzing) [Helicobacter sp. MIT 14-3879]RDU62098.1 UDP-N-acetylglucosamine 2-epimerase (non-hydrolyzing) [Helicobacter sp. MIT 14-3879]
MKKILFIFGTRPEAIKMIPLILEFRQEKSIQTKVCVTAQHRSMLDSVLELFNVVPDFDLNIMQESQDLFSISSNILSNLKSVLEECKPHYIFVHGDTSTTLMGALSGFYLKIKVCHIEAGLRSNDKYNPFPEEVNRVLTTKLATYHFAPTKLAKKNLLKDGVKKDYIKVVGNSVIDCLKLMQSRIDKKLESNIISKLNLPLNKKFILVTAHRRESFGEDIKNIAYALKEIANNLKDIMIIYPLHLNPNIKQPMQNILGDIKNIYLINPLSYECFVYLMGKCYLILTDSGGIQEEASAIRKPTLILRNTTERKEALECKTLKLVGTNKDIIVKETIKLFKNKKLYKQMSNPKNSLPYGDGNTSKKILKFIKKI